MVKVNVTIINKGNNPNDTKIKIDGQEMTVSQYNYGGYRGLISDLNGVWYPEMDNEVKNKLDTAGQFWHTSASGSIQGPNGDYLDNTKQLEEIKKVKDGDINLWG